MIIQNYFAFHVGIKGYKMINNFMTYIYHKNNDQPCFYLCENCGELFYNLDNKEYVIDKTIDLKYDVFGDVESIEDYEIYRVIYRCPYCEWKHKESLKPLYS